MGDEVAKVLRAITFQLNLPLVNSTTARYGFENFLARVERLPKDASPGEVRYGVLVDVEDGTGYGQNLMLLEIPTTKATPPEIEAEQAEFIRDHIRRMRTEWQNYLKKFDKDGLTVDQFDAQRRFTQSVDGRWQILRGFRLNENVTAPAGTVRAKYKPISDEMLKEVPGTDAFLAQLGLQMFPFIEGEQYKISVDWVIPYICLESTDNANHFDTTIPSQANANFFFPFHNFQFEPAAPVATKFTAAGEQVAATVGIKIEATYHVPLAYFTYAVDQVEGARSRIQEKLKPYATYVGKLSAAQAILQTYGPLKQKSGAELTQIAQRQASNYDGGVSDPDDDQDPDHLSEQALGLIDVMEAKDIFLQVIEKETELGRGRSDAVIMEQWAGILADMFFNKGSSPVPGNPPVKFAVREIYEDLWVHNIDPYGYELYSLKSNQIISQSSSGKSVQKDFMNTMLYENPLLQSSSAKLLPKVQFWTDQFYRTVNLVATGWQFYYSFRDVDLRNRAVIQVRSEIPDPAKIMNFYRDFAVRNLPAGVRDIDGPLALVWEVTDEQVHHLVRFLLGDANLADVTVAEQRMVLGAREILRGTKGLPEFTQIELLRKYAEEVKLALIQGKFPAGDLRKVEGIGSKLSFAISLFSFGLALSAHKRDAGVLDVARLATIGMGVVADFGALMAHLLRIEAAVVQNVAGTITRVGLGIGRFSLLFGGVGGAIGVCWSVYDAVGSLIEGRREDALLDAISAVALAMTTVGGALGVTGVGLVLVAVGIAVLIVAQAIKFFGTNEVENTTRSLYTASLPDGMDSFDFFKDELDNGTVKGPFDTIPKIEAVKALLDRVDEFFRDKDTFDLFPKKVTP